MVNKRKLERRERNKKDKSWRLAVREQARNKCQVCDAIGKLDCHHILPKERYKEFRTENINGVLLCSLHHKFGKLSAHRNPVWFCRWLEEQQTDKYNWALNNI